MRAVSINHGKARRNAGYALLLFLLMLAVLTIVLMKAAPKVAIQIRREQEEETVQRAHQYVVAIRRFYRKFGRYPNTLQELELTNNLRFLRREYKDPITGNDFRLLHPGEATLTPTGFFGQSPNGQNGNGPGMPVAQGSSDNSSGIAGQNAGAGNSLFQPLTANADQSPDIVNSGAGSSSLNQNGSGLNQSGASSIFGNSNNVGGGPIIGVAGTSKQKSLLVVNGKDHYNDWQFAYDPRTETLQGIGVGAGIAGGGGNGIAQPGMTVPVNTVQPQQPQPQPMPNTP